MRNKRISVGLTAILAISSAIMLMTGTHAVAQQETVLYSFGGSGMDAFDPRGDLIFDSAGNLHGTTLSGGAHNWGAVFELLPQAGGGWTEKVLHSFDFNGSDGAAPNAGLVFDAAGHLYGTTISGGAYTYGTVFELTPQADGTWSEKVLYSFSSSGDRWVFALRS